MDVNGKNFENMKVLMFGISAVNDNIDTGFNVEILKMNFLM
jgi:hypothetical protein